LERDIDSDTNPVFAPKPDKPKPRHSSTSLRLTWKLISKWPSTVSPSRARNLGSRQ